MKIEDIQKIAVIGAGNMGHQISTLCAMKGFNTTCTDINADILKKAEGFVDQYLPGRVEESGMGGADSQGEQQQHKQHAAKPDQQACAQGAVAMTWQGLAVRDAPQDNQFLSRPDYSPSGGL